MMRPEDLGTDGFAGAPREATELWGHVAERWPVLDLSLVHCYAVLLDLRRPSPVLCRRIARTGGLPKPNNAWSPAPGAPGGPSLIGGIDGGTSTTVQSLSALPTATTCGAPKTGTGTN